MPNRVIPPRLATWQRTLLAGFGRCNRREELPPIRHDLRGDPAPVEGCRARDRSRSSQGWVGEPSGVCGPGEGAGRDRSP